MTGFFIYSVSIHTDGLPASLSDWQDDHSLVTLADRVAHYPRHAQAALAGEAAGSSAGGEQPKFTAMVGEGDPYAVIVKYSEVVSSPVGRRWADLLIPEHLALAVMVVAGQPAAQTDIIEAGDRVFLQARRLDRESLRERSGLISLGAIDDEFVGRLQHWLDTAEALAQQGRLSAGSVARVAWADDSISVSDALPSQAKVKTAKLHHTLKRRCLPCLN